MNIIEAGIKITDLLKGKKVEGTVAAILPAERPNSQRYVVETGKDLLDVEVPTIENHGLGFLISYNAYNYHPPLERGQEISRRSSRIKPWVDGQTIFVG